MATVTEMREWLRAEGADVPERGRLRPELISLYEQAHPEPVAELSDGGISTADFDVLPDEVEPSVPMEPERRPRTQRQMRADAKPKRRTLADRLLGTPGDKPKGKGKPSVKRVGIEKFVARTYSMMGRILAPVSPAASMCIRVQAPAAGVILEDVVKGTVVDRFIQPVARAEDKANKVFALVAPPVACLGLEMVSAQVGPEGPTIEQAFRLGILREVLREGLRTGLQVQEQYADEITAAMQREAEYDEEVDKLIALIFPPQPMPESEPEMAGAAA